MLYHLCSLPHNVSGLMCDPPVVFWFVCPWFGLCTASNRGFGHIWLAQEICKHTVTVKPIVLVIGLHLATGKTHICKRWWCISHKWLESVPEELFPLRIRPYQELEASLWFRKRCGRHKQHIPGCPSVYVFKCILVCSGTVVAALILLPV